MSATNSKISIYRDGTLIGDGYVTEDYEIVDCTALADVTAWMKTLGPDADASDETYEAICAAIAGECQLEGEYTGEGEITRPDGVYSWEIAE